MTSSVPGGQAIFEGVMIRRGEVWAAAARSPGGAIVTTAQRFAPRRRTIFRLPLVRGVFAVGDSIRIGLRATSWSQRIARGPDHHESRVEQAVALMVVSSVLGVFVVLPALVGSAVGSTNGTLTAVVEGVARLALFVSYLGLIGLLPGIRRTFQYHGAEHMVISAFEHEGVASIESASRHSVRHPRCGTDLLLLVVVLSVVVFTVLRPGFDVSGVVVRAATLPMVASVAYEFLRLGGHDTLWGRALARPGLMLQRFTTRQPHHAELAVAVAALNVLLNAEHESAQN